MAYKLRIEYPGAVYHVINRGNYRADIFATQGAREAFVRTLDEACTRSKWVIHAWCLMSNHYHLALRTPQANLVAGMQWFQSTFSSRFNRFRKERGHVFQGRYKALSIEPGTALGAVCHYIHLNPIRAKMMPVDDLVKWPWGSFYLITNPKKRASWFDAGAALANPAELPDTPAGRRAYGDYLAGLAVDDVAQKELFFDRMSKGWAVGSREFKKVLLKDAADPSAIGMEDVVEARELVWERELDALEKAFGARETTDTAKSADWKVVVATEMKRRTTATNRWLSERLDMGSPFTVSRLAKECREGKRAAHLQAKLTAKSKA